MVIPDKYKRDKYMDFNRVYIISVFHSHPLGKRKARKNRKVKQFNP